MALPSTGQLSFSQIYAEVYGSHTTQQCSMFAMATSAGKSTTNIGVDDWYGYSNFIETLTVSPTSWTASWLGDSQLITVTSNTSWSASVTLGTSFLLLSLPSSGTGNGSFTINASKNIGGPRSGSVEVNTIGSISRAILILQSNI